MVQSVLKRRLLKNFTLTYIKERFLSDEEIIEHLFVRTKLRLTNIQLQHRNSTTRPRHYGGPSIGQSADGTFASGHRRFPLEYLFRSFLSPGPLPTTQTLRCISHVAQSANLRHLQSPPLKLPIPNLLVTVLTRMLQWYILILPPPLSFLS